MLPETFFFLVLPSMRPYCRFLKFFKILTDSSSPDQLSPGKGREMTIPRNLSSLRYFFHFVKLVSTALGQQGIGTPLLPSPSPFSSFSLFPLFLPPHLPPSSLLPFLFVSQLWQLAGSCPISLSLLLILDCIGKCAEPGGMSKCELPRQAGASGGPQELPAYWTGKL